MLVLVRGVQSYPQRPDVAADFPPKQARTHLTVNV